MQAGRSRGIALAVCAPCALRKAGSMSDITVFKCSTIGVAGVTDVHVRQNADGQFEARVGFALMGEMQMTPKEYAACEGNPFHKGYWDNYASGIGSTKEEALEKMKGELREVRDSLWAFE